MAKKKTKSKDFESTKAKPLSAKGKPLSTSTKSKKTTKKPGKREETPLTIKREPCPICHKKTLTLSESETDVPFFGKTYLFSMDCSNCGYHKADVEAAEKKEACKYIVEIDCDKDMHIRVVKSSNATVKIPHIGSIEPGQAANGYITNIEGILQRIKKQVEVLRDDAEEDADRKKAKNMIKKLTRVMWGQEKLKMSIEDPSGNSAIISDKAKKT